MAVTPTVTPVGSTVNTLTLAAGSAGGVAVALTIDPVADYLLIYTNSGTATQGINRNTLLGLASQPLGLTDTQSPTNKTFDNTNTITLKDTLFTLQDDGDTTKQAKFQLSGITTGTTRTYTLPNASSTLMDTSTAQTATNKTFTSPTINSPTITNATISADTISGFTVSNNGSIYGISVTGGTIGAAGLASNSVTTAKLNAASVTPDKLATGAANNTITTASTTAGGGYGNLGDAITQGVTVTIGANGLALVSISCISANSGANENRMTYAMSGTNTLAAADANCVVSGLGTANVTTSRTKVLTGLTPGSTTFTLSYRVTGGTGTFSNREISVVPL
jgi:hypothetical protein